MRSDEKRFGRVKWLNATQQRITKSFLRYHYYIVLSKSKTEAEEK